MIHTTHSSRAFPHSKLLPEGEGVFTYQVLLLEAHFLTYEKDLIFSFESIFF